MSSRQKAQWVKSSAPVSSVIFGAAAIVEALRATQFFSPVMICVFEIDP